MTVDRGLLDKAINIINNVGNYGPLDATIDSYKQAADYADDARQYAELAESGVADLNVQIARVTALASQVNDLDEEVKESFDIVTKLDVSASEGPVANATYNKEDNIIEFTLPAGEDGTDGESTYQLWERQPGNEGKTEAQFLESINGTDGRDGIDGTNGKDGKDGKDGTNGTNGYSAYELAVIDGYSGTLDDFNNLNTKSLSKEQNLSDLDNIATARANLQVPSKTESTAEINAAVSSKASKGANADITELSGLTVALSVSQGGTGAKTASSAIKNLGISNSQKVYLYSFFNSDANSKVDLATSTNASSFKRITNPGLTTKSDLTPVVGRDPSIVFFKGWWLIAVTGYSPNTYDSTVYRSRDLNEWELVRIKYGASAVTGTTMTGGQVVTDKIWAPEWVVDGDNLYLLASFRYYSDSTDKNGATIAAFKPFYSLCSSVDDLTFGSPVALNLPISTNVIDPSIVKKSSNSLFYCLIKDENLKTIKVYSATTFTGNYTSVGTVPFTADAEGPCAVELPNGSIRIFADYYATDFHCHYIDTADFSTYGSVGKLDMEGKMRHGAVLDVSKFDNPTLALSHLATLSMTNTPNVGGLRIKLTTDAGGSGTGNFTVNPTTTPLVWKPVPNAVYYTDETDGVVTISNLPVTYPDGTSFFVMLNSSQAFKGVLILKAGTSANGIFNPSADYSINPLSYHSNKLIKFTSYNGLWYSDALIYNESFIVSSPDRSSVATGGGAIGGQIGSRLVHNGITGSGTSLVTLDARAIVGSQDYACIVYRNWQGASKTWNFQSDGNALASNGSWTNSSDERIKDDIAIVGNALDSVLSWRGVTWNYKLSKDDPNGEKTFGVGLIAQDVQKSCPKAVSTSGKRSFYDGTVVEDVMSLNTSGVAAAYHTEAIKELYAIIQDQAKQIKDLSDKINS